MHGRQFTVLDVKSPVPMSRIVQRTSERRSQTVVHVARRQKHRIEMVENVVDSRSEELFGTRKYRYISAPPPLDISSFLTQTRSRTGPPSCTPNPGSYSCFEEPGGIKREYAPWKSLLTD